MAVTDTSSLHPPPPRPALPKGWRWFMRVSGVFAILAFLTPTFYVVKYYALDCPREEAHARTVSLTRFVPTVSVGTVAPPLTPTAPGNAATFYTRAIQSYADRAAQTMQRSGDAVRLPTPAETDLFREGARRPVCRFFATGPAGKPLFVFRDPDLPGRPTPYRIPRSPHEPYRYLGAAGGLAGAMSDWARLPEGDSVRRAAVGRAIIRFGDGLGREEATWTHVQVALDIQKIGLLLLLPEGGAALKKYVYAEQAYEAAGQKKFRRIRTFDADNLLLQARVAQRDADPMWRREAVWALGETLAAPGIMLRRPLETLKAKSALADISAHDSDRSVREAAAETLGEVAARGAVIRR